MASLIGIAAANKRQQESADGITPFDLTLLGLATYRGGRLIAYDKVMAPFRAPFTETKKDDYGAGESVVSKGEGVQKAIGELVSCPTCVGTWVSALLLFGLGFAPGFTRIVMIILAGSGSAEIFSALLEALSWSGKAARKQANPDK